MIVLHLILLSLLVIAWCIMHSALISCSVTDALHRRLGAAFRFYRLFFNLISALTLIPVVLYAFSVRTGPVFGWHGSWRIAQILLLVAAAVLFSLGARRYDAGQFLGVRQILSRTAKGGGIADAGELDTSGILSMVRHPWYLASILLLWARSLDIAAIYVNVIFTAYLITGSFLEERKLVREFGEQYRAYQKNVSMLLPVKWLRSRIVG